MDTMCPEEAIQYQANLYGIQLDDYDIDSILARLAKVYGSAIDLGMQEWDLKRVAKAMFISGVMFGCSKLEEPNRTDIEVDRVLVTDLDVTPVSESRRNHIDLLAELDKLEYRLEEYKAPKDKREQRAAFLRSVRYITRNIKDTHADHLSKEIETETLEIIQQFHEVLNSWDAP